MNYVIAGEHQEDFNAKYVACGWAGMQILLFDKLGKPLPLTKVNPYVKDGPEWAVPHALYALGWFVKQEDHQSRHAVQAAQLSQVVSGRAFRKVIEEHKTWLKHAPIDEGLQLQLRQALMTHLSLNDDLTKNVMTMIARMEYCGCDIFEYVHNNFRNEQPVQVLEMIDKLTCMDGQNMLTRDFMAELMTQGWAVHRLFCPQSLPGRKFRGTTDWGGSGLGCTGAHGFNMLPPPKTLGQAKNHTALQAPQNL